MKIKISYVSAETIEQLKEEVNKELEALQLNVNNRIIEVRTLVAGSGFVAQVAYADVANTVQRLMEESEANVHTN